MENYKILLVEDDGSLIDGLEYSLKKDGFLVDIARNVQEFLHIYEKGKYDLLLLDVTLPDGNGFEICEKVRKESEVPILFLTAADEEFNVVRGLDMGGDDYVSKPFRLNELLSRIHSLLRRAGKRIKRGRKRPGKAGIREYTCGFACEQSISGRTAAGAYGSGVQAALSLPSQSGSDSHKGADPGQAVGRKR